MFTGDHLNVYASLFHRGISDGTGIVILLITTAAEWGDPRRIVDIDPGL